MRRLLLVALAASAVLVSSCTTANVLPDGRVLLLALTGNKLFDPATGTATVTGPLPAPVFWFASAVLPDGKVLVTGGSVDNTPVATAEIWDPATGTFSPTGDMGVPRSLHTATTLADGRVLIVGGGVLNTSGAATSTPPLATAEIFDPKTGTFTATGSMPAGRMMHTATLLTDGRVLIAGGSSDDKTNPAPAMLYDPGSGTFTPTGSLAGVRIVHTATRLADGRVLIAGGLGANLDTPGPDGLPALTASELYDPASGAFSATGDLGVGRFGHTATLLGDGRVLVAGGLESFNITASTPGASPPPSAASASAELYDPATGTFSPTGAMTTQRVFHVAALLPDGRVLLVGGDKDALSSGTTGGTPSDLLKIAESYDPGAGTFSEVALP